MGTGIRLTVVALASLGAGACARAAIPPPEATAAEFARAARQGDSEAVYALLSREARERYGSSGVRERVRDAKGELVRRAQALEKGPLVVQQQAEVRYLDGESARLTVERGGFRISSASGLPERSETPAEALESLRRALARRSYAQLSRVLSAETRSALERDMSSLVIGLETPETLPLEVDGDRAEVSIPGGHKVWLRKESGTWKVHDFE
jgi:hypothetical protein